MSDTKRKGDEEDEGRRGGGTKRAKEGEVDRDGEEETDGEGGRGGWMEKGEKRGDHGRER